MSGPIVNRVFAYVGDGGVDWSGTSGRDVVYGEAVAAIENGGPFGYGLFSWGIDYYPHNLLLELLLNGGILYAASSAILLAAFALRAVRLPHSDPSAGVILPLSLYPLSMLQFSGTYMTTGPLWFFLAFMLCLETGAAPQLIRASRRRPHGDNVTAAFRSGPSRFGRRATQLTSSYQFLPDRHQRAPHLARQPSSGTDLSPSQVPPRRRGGRARQ